MSLLAGLAIAGLLVPEAVAYAAIAGVPPVHGLATALAGLLIYPFIGTSRFATLSATSSAAAIFASVVAANGAASAFALVGISGRLFVIAALARAHFLAAFVSRPVLRGFAWALAVTIVIKRLPGLTGVPTSSTDTLPLLWEWRRSALRCMAQRHGPGRGRALALWLVLHRLQARHAWIQPSVLQFWGWASGCLPCCARRGAGRPCSPRRPGGMAPSWTGTAGYAPCRWRPRC